KCCRGPLVDVEALVDDQGIDVDVIVQPKLVVAGPGPVADRIDRQEEVLAVREELERAIRIRLADLEPKGPVPFATLDATVDDGSHSGRERHVDDSRAGRRP